MPRRRLVIAARGICASRDRRSPRRSGASRRRSTRHRPRIARRAEVLVHAACRDRSSHDPSPVASASSDGALATARAHPTAPRVALASALADWLSRRELGAEALQTRSRTERRRARPPAFPISLPAPAGDTLSRETRCQRAWIEEEGIRRTPFAPATRHRGEQTYRERHARAIKRERRV